MRILLTGGTSPIGEAVHRRLRADGHDVAAPTRTELDLTKPDEILTRFARPWEAVVHLARTGSFRTELAAVRALVALGAPRFVYMSSWVVSWAEKSAIVDGYTRSKRACEGVIRTSDIPNRVILRPSLVVGANRLVWDRSIGIFASCHGRAVWLVSLEEVVDALATIALKSDKPVETIDLWGIQAEAASASAVFGAEQSLRTRIFASLSRVLRNVAVFGFLQREASPKLTDRLTDPRLFAARQPGREFRPRSSAQLESVLIAQPAVRAYGRGWTRSTWFQAHQAGAPVRVGLPALRHERDYDPASGLLTVEAGATFEALFDMLDLHDRSVRCVPEFRDVSLGAAVMTDIHGSSPNLHVFADQIRSVRVHANGEWHDRMTAREAREAGPSAVIHTIEIETVPNTPLLRECRIVEPPREASELLALLCKSESTTIQWYFRQRRLMVWTHHASARPADTPEYVDGQYLRRYHPAMMRLHPPRLWSRRGHRLLATWTSLNRLERFVLARPSSLRNIEFCVPAEAFGEVLDRLRARPPDNAGFRLSPRGVWVDLTVREPECYAAWGFPLNAGKWLPPSPEEIR